MHWYYSEAGKARGPFTEEKLSELAHAGTVSAETLIWQPELEEWKPVIILLPKALQPVPRELATSPAPTPKTNPFAAEPEPLEQKQGVLKRLSVWWSKR